MSGICSANSGLSMVKISRGIGKLVYEVKPFGFLEVCHKIPLVKNRNKSPISAAQFVPIEISTICCYTMPSNCTYIRISMRKVKASHNSVQVKHVDESNFLLEKNPALIEVQRYIFDPLLKHHLTRDNTFALIRSCGKDVFKVEQSKGDT